MAARSCLRPRLAKRGTERQMQFVVQLANPSASLQALFDALPDKPIARKGQSSASKPTPQRLANGDVQRAIAKVLTGVDSGLSVSTVHKLVTELLGHPVSRNSVKWSLSDGSRGAKPRFERVSHGCYRLKTK